ncbi:MAG: amidase [Pseudomonadota bacterium]
MTALHFASIADAGRALRGGDTSSVALTTLMLERIAAHDAALNAFITVTDTLALAAARRADAELAAGYDRGPLHGIPIAIKDLCDTAGVRTTRGSRLFADHVPERDAHVVRRLHEAGAVMLGKTGLHELAYGTTSENDFFGPVHNPWRLDYISGGSSGGSAAAVAAGLAFGAVGTDTGCSIRQPAHCCGIVGHKPTYGLVSKAGVQPLVWSLDHVGPITRTVADAALMLSAMAGFDPEDPCSVDTAAGPFDSAGGQVEGLRLGVVRRFFFDGREDVIATIDAAIAGLVAAGAQVVTLDVPEIAMASEQGRHMFVEALAVHERDLAERPNDFGAEVRGKLEALKRVSAADYARAKRYQPEFARRMEGLLEHCDVLCAPASTITAMPVGDLPDDFHFNAWKNTCVFDYTGQPSISVPCGFTADELPVGLMLTGRRFEDAALLRAARAVEETLGAYRVPPLFAG